MRLEGIARALLVAREREREWKKQAVGGSKSGTIAESFREILLIKRGTKENVKFDLVL